MNENKSLLETEFGISKDNTVFHLDEYQNLAMRTNNENDWQKMILNGALGLCGESGEVADLIKKWIAQGHALNADKVIQELGDVMWYVALTARSLGYSLSEVATINVEKLKLRYPNGFDPEKSINRKSEGETK